MIIEMGSDNQFVTDWRADVVPEWGDSFEVLREKWIEGEGVEKPTRIIIEARVFKGDTGVEQRASGGDTG